MAHSCSNQNSWLLVCLILYSISADITYMSIYWDGSKGSQFIEGNIDLTIPVNETTAYNCSSTGLTSFCISHDVLTNDAICSKIQIDPGWSQWDPVSYIWYIPCSSIEEISPYEHGMFRAVFHYEGNSSFDIDGILALSDDGRWNIIDQFCVPQNHFYWASQTGTYECTDYNDQLTISNSMTLYIAYGYRSSFHGIYLYYTGGVSTAPIKYINITARGRTKDYTEEAVLTLYWNWYIYRCSILFNNITTSYSCGAAELNLSNNNCSEYAFGVGLEIHDGLIPYIDSISITDEDTNTQIMNESISINESSIIVDFSTVWSGTTIDIYKRGVNSMCFLATDVPTNSPSNAPSVAPSQSPTQHPIIYSDFQYEIFALFRITGWTDSEISDVNNDTELFLTLMTTYIHQGFDQDDDLEYRDIVLNITNISNNFQNNVGTNDQLEKMDLQYLIECRDVFVCHYISGENTTVQMDHDAFETFVTNQLNSHFSSGAVYVDSNDSLLFTVMNMTMSIDTDEKEGIGIFVIILFICAALCLLISGISIGVILYHRKRQQRGPVAAEGNDHADPPRHEEQNPNELAVPLTPTTISAKISATISPSTHNAEGQEGVPATGFGFPEGEGQIMYQNSNEQRMSVELQPNEEQKHGDSDHEDSAKVPSPGKGAVE